MVVQRQQLVKHIYKKICC